MNGPDKSWIVVPNWERFQHYGLSRRPPWIKNYTTLLHKDEYLDLPLAARGLLHGIWLAYADRQGRLRTSEVPGILLGRARDAHLTSLNDAGLIDFRASKPLLLNLEDPKNTVLAVGAGPTSSEMRAAAAAYAQHDNGPSKVEVDEASLAHARAWLEANR